LKGFIDFLDLGVSQCNFNLQAFSVEDFGFAPSIKKGDLNFRGLQKQAGEVLPVGNYP